jgi:hypothetical protein
VRVEREEQARGRRRRAAREDGVQRDAQRRHLPPGRRGSGCQKMAGSGSLVGFGASPRRGSHWQRPFTPLPLAPLHGFSAQ